MPVKNFAQNNKEFEGIEKSDTAIIKNSSDTIPNVDTIPKTNKSNLIDTKIDYNAQDSIVLSRDSKKVYLYNKAKVTYGDIILEADYIEYDQENKFVYAKGVEDSLGNLVGNPVFKEQNDEFKAKTIKYNFITKKGYIEDVFTKEDEGFLHSKETKKLADNSFLMKNGKYTTCDNEDHPHFYLFMTKAKVVPNDKIISGPAYLVMEDIPFKFLGVPFGFFPNQKEFSSGIIIPKYGEESNRGFFLQDGGYYFGISDKMDLTLTGDIFSKGSWAGDVGFRYVKRYKFSSNFNFSYAVFIKSEKDLIDYEENKNMSIRWTHMQDPKANPSTKFSASVNYSTSEYDNFNSRTPEQRATNQKSSSISYGKTWAGSPFRLNLDFRHSQNSNTNNVTLTLPVLTFNMDRQYPFRKKNSSGELKWYENIEVQYSSKAENRITTQDSLLFNGTKFSDFENGFQNTIPISTNFKILKHFNLSPKLEYIGILYPSFVNYTSTVIKDPLTNKSYVDIDTIIQPTVRYAQMVKPSISLSAGPNIYGTYQFKNLDAKIIAVRHVITPSASISYVPDLGSMVNGYYGSYYTDTLQTKEREYSVFQNGIYPFPSTPGQSGVISFGLNNNLEMKVRNYDDTTGTGSKKIKLLESLKLSTSYNIFADSLNWSQLSINGRTSMFENKLSLNFGAIVDPYALDENGSTYNKFQWNTSEGGLGRLEKIDFSLDFTLNSKKGEEKTGQEVDNTPSRNELDELRAGRNIMDHEQVLTYVDFSVPWDLSANYKFVYTKTGFASSKKITQTLSLSGNISLTPNWKISFRTNYDLVEKVISSTSINIHRDLHCWEMTFGWIPVGYMQSYTFQINVKGSTLRDFLKYDKRKSWQDNL